MKNILIIITFLAVYGCTFPADPPIISNTVIDTTIPPHDGFTQVWQSEFSELVRHSSPVIYEDWVITMESDSWVESDYILKAYDKETGAVEWEWIDESFMNSGGNLRLYGQYLLINTNEFVALMDLTSREILWKDIVEEGEWDRNQFVLHDGFLYYEYMYEDPTVSFEAFDKNASRLCRRELVSGQMEIIYTEKYGDVKNQAPLFGTPTFYKSKDGKDQYIQFTVDFMENGLSGLELFPDLVCFKMDGMEQVWRVSDAYAHRSSKRSTFQDDFLYLTGDWSFYKFDAYTGERIWRSEIKEHENFHLFSTDTKIEDGIMYSLTDLGVLYGVDINSGNVVIQEQGSANCAHYVLSQGNYLVYGSWADATVTVFDRVTRTFHKWYLDSGYYSAISYDPASDYYFNTTYEKIQAFRIHI